MRRHLMETRVLRGSLALAAAILLVACEESVSETNELRNSTASIQKVCTREYFYNFGEARFGNDNIYCAEWEDRCTASNGEAVEECA